MAKSDEMFIKIEMDGLRLITPTHISSVANAGWTKENLHYRSRVETPAGVTVSQGFPKFFNLGMGPDGLRIEVEDVIKAVAKGDAVATLKLDGSLLIRSVHEGQVMLRTRGSFGYASLDNAHEIDLFKTKYPRLFDPTWFPGEVSLLFEWTSPENVIVLKYPEPELTLIGAINNLTFKMVPMHRLKLISELIDVPMVKYFPLDPDGWRFLYDTLETNTEIEGYVIRLNGEQDLVKVKCSPYLTKHALKSSLDTEGLIDMWMDYGKPGFESFVESFKSSFDEEICMWAYGAICALYDGVRTTNKILEHMQGKTKERATWSRKDVALTGLAEYGQTKRFSVYMNLWEGKPVPKDLEKSIILQNTKQVELGMFKNEEG